MYVIRHLTRFRTLEIGKCPKGFLSYGAKQLQDLRRVRRAGAARNVSHWAKMTRRLNVIGPTLANAKPSNKVVDLHKVSGSGSGSYPVVRQWVDGLHARRLYANGDLKPDQIPLASFSDGTKVLAHSNANHKVNTHDPAPQTSGAAPYTYFVISVNGPQKPKDEQSFLETFCQQLQIFEGERTSFSATWDRHVLCRKRIVACIADTLEQAALGNLVGARGLASCLICSIISIPHYAPGNTKGYLPLRVPHAKAFKNDEGVIILVLDHPKWAGLVDTATTFQIPGGRGV
ncbi:BQ5605_C036g11542 [Microbotryum silenes-dioicae]|uniref:BQ5605_C036g11542 protein n=1 Tax=Microbotryum silenes-dioicae TaxID=796604 RepID=A0A2X0MJL9_9BASI|nr:BQ5605_C036g11542 [Microbotryum silenes-dioicae]